jgi:hypothetical protein
MTDSSGDLAAVEQLLAEGDAIRGWLTRLDQAQPATGPAGVRERVRTDYQRRLDQITAGLSAHSEVVESRLRADRQEHAELLARANDTRDALAEAELRHAVGEFDADRFEGEQRRFTSDIETFDLALGAAAERIARLEEVQAVAQRAPRPPVIEVEFDAPSETAVPEVHNIPIGELAPDAEDALAVFEESAGGGSVPGTSTSGHGPLSFRPSGASPESARHPVAPPTRPRAFDSATPLGIPAADIPPRFVRPGERFPAPSASPPPVVDARSDVAPVAVPDTANPDAGGASAGRTLRCGECGAMNRPLEWYCEKCGAELTAV